MTDFLFFVTLSVFLGCYSSGNRKIVIDLRLNIVDLRLNISPAIWNSLPKDLHDSSISLLSFKSMLKTHLFRPYSLTVAERRALLSLRLLLWRNVVIIIVRWTKGNQSVILNQWWARLIKLVINKLILWFTWFRIVGVSLWLKWLITLL